MKYIQILLITILMFVNFALPAFGREIKLYWEPSPSPGVIGYKVYYQQGTPRLPLAGTEADQGSSPIDVENSLMATVSGLQETAVYYFSVTAYDSNKTESAFSNIVGTAWMPPLLSPQNESVIVPLNVTFQWEAGPPEHYLNYTLYYGTDQNQVIYAGGTTPSSFVSFPNTPLPTSTQGLLIVIALMVMLTTLSVAYKKDRRIVYLRRTAVSGIFIFLLVACGGGGGSDSSGENASPSPLPSSVALTSVNAGSSTSYLADKLESGSTYYWKVDAHSTAQPGTVFHSQVYSFTTE